MLATQASLTLTLSPYSIPLVFRPIKALWYALTLLPQSESPYAPPEGIIEGSSFFLFLVDALILVVRGLCAWAVTGWRLAEFDSLADMLNARAIILANNLV